MDAFCLFLLFLQQHRNLTNEIRRFYFGDGAIDKHVYPQYFEYLSDSNYAYPIHKSVKTLAAKSEGKTCKSNSACMVCEGNG